MDNVAYDLQFTLDRAAHTALPDTPQGAGCTGDHHAAQVTFLLTAPPADRLYRVEVNDGCGGYDLSELLEEQGGAVVCTVPASWTAAGTATLRLVEIAVDEAGTEQMVYHYPPVRLTFADRCQGETVGEAALPAWQSAVNGAEAAEKARREAEAARQAAEKQRAENCDVTLLNCKSAAEEAYAVAGQMRDNMPAIVDGQWYLGETATGVPATGDSGLPKVKELSDDEYIDPDGTTLGYGGYLESNVEYRLTKAIKWLTLLGLNAGEAGCSELWSITFAAGDTITVTVPDTVVWAVADPVFEPNRTYWLSFVPFGAKHLGVWSVI